MDKPDFNLLNTSAPATTVAVRLLAGIVFFAEGIKKFMFPAESSSNGSIPRSEHRMLMQRLSGALSALIAVGGPLPGPSSPGLDLASASRLRNPLETGVLSFRFQTDEVSD
jgi:hypothetical protein